VSKDLRGVEGCKTKERAVQKKKKNNPMTHRLVQPLFTSRPPFDGIPARHMIND
jgi:hypothetical protein